MTQTAQEFYPHTRFAYNSVLLKDDVGKAKPSTFNLPPINFIYGRPLDRDQEGAKEVSMTWKFHQETRDQDPNRDFVALNKMTINNGVCKASFRKENDARQKIQKGKNCLPMYIPEEEFRYGKPNRPSTPMRLVIGNCYGLESQLNLEEEYKIIAENQKMQKTNKLIPKSNKASYLCQSYLKSKQHSILESSQKEPFKLTKFKNITPRTDTHLGKSKLDKSNKASFQDPQQQD